MNFNERFFKKIVEHSESINKTLKPILENQKTLDGIINTLGENTLQALTAAVGKDLGIQTRNNTLKDYTGEPLEKLKQDFKEHMEKHNALVFYGLSNDHNELFIEVHGCIFANNEIKWRFCSYSTNFLKHYFNASEITPLCTQNKEQYCFFKLKINS